MLAKCKSDKVPKFKKSACWYFMNKTTRGACCKICQTEIFSKPNDTTNFRNHLRRKHEEYWTAIMENRLEPKALEVLETGTIGNGPDNGTLQILENEEALNNLPEDAAPSEEELSSASAENSAQAPADPTVSNVNGETYYLVQPVAEGEGVVQIQPVANSESIHINGGAKTREEGSPAVRFAPVKDCQGSSVNSRIIARQSARPSPLSSAPPRGNSTNNHNSSNYNNDSTEDSFDAFGKYVASMLRSLPSYESYKLQGEIVNWILKAKIKNDTN